MGSFKYNGVSSEDLGLVVQTPPSYEFPERDVSTTHVPGRNGDVIVDNKCYKNVTRTYSIAKGFRLGMNYYDNSESILKWLTSAKGKYVRLEDSYDNKIYRLATFNDSGTFLNYFDKAESIQISFDCKPQRFSVYGEIPVTFKGSASEIVNDYGYTSLPKITVNNLPKDIGEILMLTIKDESSITSSITLSKISDGSIVLDSEDESAVDLKGNSLTECVNLNGKTFPKLNAGKNTFLFEKYEQERSILSPYTTIIAENQKVCTIKYMPYVALEEAAQTKIKVLAFNELKTKYQESYYADAVQTYTKENAEEYTFASFNTILNNNGESFAFTGDKISNEGTFPDWLQVNYLTGDDDGKVELVAKISGFFMCTNTDKKIFYRSAGSVIATGISYASVITVNYYKGSDGALEIIYEDLPSWLGYNLKYTDNSPISVTYIGKLEGYYWADKTWIFGKAGWNRVTKEEGSEIVRKEFATLKWSSSKKAFTSTSGFSTSTTSTFTYRYVSELPQYKDITETITNDDGSKVTKVTSKCYFTIKDIGTKIENIIVSATQEGYYSYALNDGDATSYTFVNKNGSIIQNLSGTAAFEIFYLNEVPTYAKEDEFDTTLLDPNKILKQGGSDINPVKFTFKVLKKGYYRYSYKDDDGNEVYTEWDLHNANDELRMEQSPTDTFYICYIEQKPQVYDFDRQYNGGSTIPNYIIVTYYKDSELGEIITKEQYDAMTSDEKANVTIRYTAGKDGYYKWDSNDNWVKKSAGDEILICNLKDDAVIYYMESLPTYVDYELKDLFHTKEYTDSNGNPNQVDYIIDQAGYYKYNNTNDWVYYNKGDVMLSASISSTNTVYHLKKLEDTLENIEMIIIPRWWSL